MVKKSEPYYPLRIPTNRPEPLPEGEEKKGTNARPKCKRPDIPKRYLPG